MPLPPGLILNPATGEVTGTPTQAGTYSVQLRVRDTLGTTTEVTDEVVINPYTVQTFSGDLGPLMDTRAMIDYTLAHAGGQAPYAFTVFSGALPDGLSLNAGTGEITGVPTTPGAYAFTLRVTDNLAQVVDTVLSGDVDENLVFNYDADLRGTVGVAYTESGSRVGGTDPVTYEVQTGSLPPGLTLNAANGAITGTPTAAGDYNATVLATDTYGYTDASPAHAFSIKVKPTLSGALPRGTVTTAYASAYAGAGGHLPYAWGATGLPSGLSINASTGDITGTPTVAGDFNPVITLTDDKGNVVQRTNKVSIAADLDLSGTAPAATREVAYSYRPTTTGGWSPYTYAIVVGALPDGITLDTATGRLSGTPTTQSINNFTVRVTDADGNTDDLDLTIDVAGDMDLTGTVDDRARVGSAYASSSLSISGGTAPYSWSISAGALPPGISLDTATGALSGTPTTVGTYNFTVKVRDANASFDTLALTITAVNAVALSGAAPDASDGVAYSYTYGRSGGFAPYAYVVLSGALPAGITLDAATGKISGTPTTPGTSSFTIQVTDDDGGSDTHADSIEVFSLPSISGGYADNGELTIAYGSGPSASGGKAPLQWSRTGGTIPPGLSLSGSTGALSGTPTTPGTYNFTIRVTDALGRTDSITDTVTVYARLNFTGNRFRSPAVDDVVYPDSDFSVAQASGGVPPKSYALVSGALPAGLSLNESTGDITGTPTTPGTSTFKVRATDALGVTSDADSDSIEVRSKVALGGTPSRGTRGKAYSFQPTRSGGWGVFTWSLVSGALPSGLSLNSSTGEISGTISGSGDGTATFVLRCIDNNSNINSYHTQKTYSIAVHNNVSLSVGYPRGTRGKAYSASGGNATGGWTPYTYSLASGQLPPGVSMSSSTGNLSGTPTSSGTYNSTIRVTDAEGNTDTATMSIPIAEPPVITTGYGSPHTEDQGYSSTPGRGGGWSPFTFSHVSGTIPPGLSLRASDGNLSGTPTTPGTYNFTIRVTDADGNIDDRAMSIRIDAQIADLVVTASPNPATDTAYTNGSSNVKAEASSTATTTGGLGTKTFSWTRVSASQGMLVNGGTNGATLTLYFLDSWNNLKEETWRVTARDANGDVDTYDVDFELRTQLTSPPPGGSQ